MLRETKSSTRMLSRLQLTTKTFHQSAVPAAKERARTRTFHQQPGEAFSARYILISRQCAFPAQKAAPPKKIRSTAPCRDKTGGTPATGGARSPHRETSGENPPSLRRSWFLPAD